MTTNPLLEPSTLFCELPPFSEIRDEHVLPAFEQAIAEHAAEIHAIAQSTEPATFANTIEAMERAGQNLDRVAAYFFNIAGTDATDARMEIESEIAPKLSAHFDSIYLNAALWQRISAIESVADAADAEEAERLLAKVRENFVRAGADLNEEDKAELTRINSRLSELSTAFGENLLKDTNARAVEIHDRAELAGLSDGAIDSFATYAKKANSSAPWLIPLDLPSAPALRQLTWTMRTPAPSSMKPPLGAAAKDNSVIRSACWSWPACVPAVLVCSVSIPTLITSLLRKLRVPQRRLPS